MPDILPKPRTFSMVFVITKKYTQLELSYTKARVIYIASKMLSASKTKFCDDAILNDALLEIHKKLF